MDNNIIVLENINKQIDNKLILKNINLNIKKGKFITFLGPSGCGKTTLLRIIDGLDFPTSGKIFLNENDITNTPPNKRPFNMIFQNYALFPHLNVYENIIFGLRLKKKKKILDNNEIIYESFSDVEIKEKAEKILKLIDLEDLSYRNVLSLSGGQQQRVAFARAIINDPDVLLLDEPLSAIDIRIKKDLQNELKNLQKKFNMTFIYVTHDHEEALSMSDTIVVFKDGEIQQIGTPSEIYNQPSNIFVADFVGDSNIYNGILLKDNKIHFLDKDFNCDIKKDNLIFSYNVIIRPENIKLYSYNQDKKINYKNFFGVIIEKNFKGIYFEYIVLSNKKYELQVFSNTNFELNSNVEIEIEKFYVLKQDKNINIFYNIRFINKKLFIGKDCFDCDITDENIIKNIQNFVVQIPPDKIDLSDDTRLSKIKGIIINTIWKECYYEIVIKTNKGNCFIVNSKYFWNINDIVSIIIKKEDFIFKEKTKC